MICVIVVFCCECVKIYFYSLIENKVIFIYFNIVGFEMFFVNVYFVVFDLFFEILVDFVCFCYFFEIVVVLLLMSFVFCDR